VLEHAASRTDLASANRTSARRRIAACKNRKKAGRTPFRDGTMRARYRAMSRTARNKSSDADIRSTLAGIGRLVGNGSLPPGETALMRAVLEDAIMCFLGRAKRRRIDARILSREAEHWIRSKDLESPFSFNNVCHVLGLCPESARKEILEWKARGLAGSRLADEPGARLLH
jgi:hypothetical protein